MGTVDVRLSMTLTRFWSRFEVTDSCWVFRGQRHDLRSGKGHPRLWFGGRHQFAHRIAWQLRYGRIPVGMCVLHNCPTGDNPACANPSHLWLGSIADNNRDRITKGRDFNQRKTHCRRGHDYAVFGVVIGGRRNCQPCKTAWASRKRLRMAGSQ